MRPALPEEGARALFCGYCAAKREKFLDGACTWVCRPDGVPVRVQRLPAGLHDLTPVHELAYGLPAGARLLDDKAYHSATDEASILAETGVRLIVFINRKVDHLIGEYLTRPA